MPRDLQDAAGVDRYCPPPILAPKPRPCTGWHLQSPASADRPDHQPGTIWRQRGSSPPNFSSRCAAPGLPAAPTCLPIDLLRPPDRSVPWIPWPIADASPLVQPRRCQTNDDSPSRPRDAVPKFALPQPYRASEQRFTTARRRHQASHRGQIRRIGQTIAVPRPLIGMPS